VEYATTQPPLPRAFWKSSVQKMQQKYGAQIPDAQVEPLVDYLVNNYGARSNGVAAAASPAPAATTASTRDGLDGPQIAQKYGCLGCHNASTKLIGPSYRDIAAKYKKDAEARAKVAAQVHKGGSGKWGPIIMPPFPQVSDSELKVLTDWILGLD